MRKIPTVFVRDPENRKHITAEVTPGCEWVLAGEGVATRKYDGTCVMFDGDQWWARREVKPGKTPPEGWVQEDHDDTTGKSVGWEPAGQSGFAKWIGEAIMGDEAPGTYELCGPKVQGNPEEYPHHVLVPHGQDALVMPPAPLDFLTLRTLLRFGDYSYFEGIVWHHPDGRMAKLKRRDFATDIGRPSDG